MLTSNTNRDNNGDRVLVTGATGLLGNNITRLLVQRMANVRVLMRKTASRRALEGLEVDIATGDVTDPASLAVAMEGCTGVIHAAGCVLLGWKNEALHESTNHQGAQHVARAARQAEARLVHVSTINTLGVGTKTQPANEAWSAGPNIPCPYVVSKQAGETAVRTQIESGLDGVIVHPGLMFGPWDWKPSSGRMILEVARNFVPIAPAGGISVCDVRDVAEGVLAAFDQAPIGRDYILAGHNLTYLELWQHITDVADGHRPFCHSVPPLGFIAGHIGDLWGWLTRHEPNVNSAAVKLSESFHYFDSTRAHRELGYRTRPVEQSLRDAWTWLCEYGYAKSE
ncbi:MAG: NAD-dependent epimerase/dehydratase family protein [Planctomycetota bacterium]